jgi:hypothetical protein
MPFFLPKQSRTKGYRALCPRGVKWSQREACSSLPVSADTGNGVVLWHINTQFAPWVISEHVSDKSVWKQSCEAPCASVRSACPRFPGHSAESSNLRRQLCKFRLRTAYCSRAVRWPLRLYWISYLAQTYRSFRSEMLPHLAVFRSRCKLKVLSNSINCSLNNSQQWFLFLYHIAIPGV